MLHELMRAWARLIWVLFHIGEACVSHGIHGLVLLNWSTVHRPTALRVVHLRRGVHGRLLRERRLLRRPLCILLHVVLLRQRRRLRWATLPHVGRSVSLSWIAGKHSTWTHSSGHALWHTETWWTTVHLVRQRGVLLGHW